jgi:hypothetical protein
MSLQALLPHKVVLGCTAPCTGATAAEWLAKQGDVYYVEPRHEEHFGVTTCMSSLSSNPKPNFNWMAGPVSAGNHTMQWIPISEANRGLWKGQAIGADGKVAACFEIAIGNGGPLPSPCKRQR